MLSPPVTISHLTLRSDDDPYRLHDPRAVDERAFAERPFVYIAPRLYNGLPATVQQQASIQSFKIHLKTFCFREHTTPILILLMKYINCNIVGFILISTER